MEAADAIDQAVHEHTESPAVIDLSDETSVAKFAAQLNAAGKSIQILGQILRSFSGSLGKERKLELTLACYELGMRTLSSVVQAVKANEVEIVQEYTKWLREKHAGWDDTKLRLAALGAVRGLVEMMGFGMIKHVSNSVGLRDLSKTFAQAKVESATVATKLIDLSIKLDHWRDFPGDDVRELEKALKDAGLSRNLLRGLVWLHYYLFPTKDRQERQSICADLDIVITPSLLTDTGGRRV